MDINCKDEYDQNKAPSEDFLKYAENYIDRKYFNPKPEWDTLETHVKNTIIKKYNTHNMNERIYFRCWDAFDKKDILNKENVKH